MAGYPPLCPLPLPPRSVLFPLTTIVAVAPPAISIAGPPEPVISLLSVYVCPLVNRTLAARGAAAKSLEPACAAASNMLSSTNSSKSFSTSKIASDFSPTLSKSSSIVFECSLSSSGIRLPPDEGTITVISSSLISSSCSEDSCSSGFCSSGFCSSSFCSSDSCFSGFCSSGFCTSDFCSSLVSCCITEA